MAVGRIDRDAARPPATDATLGPKEEPEGREDPATDGARCPTCNRSMERSALRKERFEVYTARGVKLPVALEARSAQDALLAARALGGVLISSALEVKPALDT